MPLAAGTRLGVFEILAPLGKGGMGEVYRAKDTKLEREVAVKILPEEMAKRPERMARFQREAKLPRSSSHRRHPRAPRGGRAALPRSWRDARGSAETSTAPRGRRLLDAGRPDAGAG